ncbi:MAG: hypothetical protein IJQ23_03540, partial [Clostridia bacterium]|nr:hypothetical protein [Clostridia bacterium]
MKKALLRVLSVICLLCCITGIGFATQNNAQADTVPTVTLKDGAWVRLSTDDAGIRFVAEIDDYSEDYTYGMYIFPTEYLDDYVSGDVVAHAKSKLAEGKKLAGGDCTPYFNEDEGGYRINGVLVNLHYGNLNREFVAVAYVRNGDNYTYSDVSVSRNIVWVSGASVASGKYAGQTTSLSILNNFIKLGSYQAIGVDETTAKAAEGLPEISVSGSTTVYAGLWENPQPTFTCNDSPITNDFNPYVSAVDEGLVYSQKNVRSFTAGSYSIGYENIDGTFTVTVRDLDENLNSDYFGVYDTVDKVSTVVDYSDSICVADAQDAEVILARDGTAKGIEINTNYDLVGKDISIPGLTLDEQMGCEPLNVYVLNSDTAEIYRTVCIKDYFYSATDYTQLFRYVGSGAFSRSNVNHKMRMTLRNEYSLNSKYPTTGFDIEYLKLAYVAGYDYLEFDVSVDAAFAGYANKGIRVFSSRQTTAMEDNAITAATGAHIYKDFGTDVTGATKFTVKVVLKDFLALDASAKQLRFSIGAPQDSNVDFSNFRIRRKSADEIVADYVSKYGFNSVNSKTTANGGKWDVAANGIMGISYNAAKGAMAVNMVNASAAINGRYYVLYTDISMLTDARAAGFNTISFKVSSDNGAFTADGRGIRVFSKTNSGMDNSSIPGATGVYVYGDYGTAADTTEFTVIIDIDNFLALNENTNYLGIVMNIPANTTAYFSDLSAAKLTPAQRAAAFASAYGFNPANSGAGGKWSATGGVMTREYDSEKDAMKVTMSDAGAAIDGRYYVLYTPIAMLTDAQTAGFNQVSFKVSSTDGA